MIQVPDRTIKLSKKQKEKAADFKIGELERQKEWLSNRVAYLMVGIQALGRKLDYSPDQAKTCIEEFIIAREQENLEQMKEKMKADIASGKKLDFKMINNMEGDKDVTQNGG